MNAKSFVKYFIALNVAIAIILQAMLWVVPEMYYMDDEYPMYRQQRDFLNTDTHYHDVMFLGDSRMKAAAIPAQISSDAYNLALGGAGTVEMYYGLIYYLEKHPAPNTVIISFAPNHYEGHGEFSFRTLYFHLLRPEDERSILSKMAELDKGNKEQEKIVKKGALPYDLRLLSEYSWSVYGTEFRRKGTNQKIYDETKSHNGQYYFGRASSAPKPNQEAKRKEFKLLHSFDYYLRELIMLCEENNIKVIIEQLPMNPASSEAIKKSGYLAAYQAYLKALSADFPDITIVYDIPEYPPDCFGDASHLNERGAKKYSAYLKEQYIK